MESNNSKSFRSYARFNDSIPITNSMNSINNNNNNNNNNPNNDINNNNAIDNDENMSINSDSNNISDKYFECKPSLSIPPPLLRYSTPPADLRDKPYTVS